MLILYVYQACYIVRVRVIAVNVVSSSDCAIGIVR